MMNVYMLVDTSGSMREFREGVTDALTGFHEANSGKVNGISYINFSQAVTVHHDAESCCDTWQNSFTNLGGAFRALEIIRRPQAGVVDFVVLISDGEHSRMFGDEEVMMKSLTGFPAIMVALGIGRDFPSNTFMKYRKIYGGVDTQYRLPPVIGVEHPGEIEEAFTVLEAMMFHWCDLVKDVDTVLDPAKAINQEYVFASQIPFLGLERNEQVQKLCDSVAKIVRIQKAQTNPAELNIQADAYTAALRDMAHWISAKASLGLSNEETKRFLTKNAKGYMLHNVSKFCEAARKRNGGSWPLAVDSLVDFLRDFKSNNEEETVDDMLTQSSEEDFFREAQLKVANLDLTTPITLGDPRLPERIEANRHLVHERCGNIVDAMEMFPVPMRGVTLGTRGRDAVAVELWRASIDALPSMIPTLNVREWLNQDLCVEFRGERINGMLLRSKYPDFLDSTYGHWLQTYALTGNIQLCSPLSVLVGYGVVAVRVLREPLTGYGKSLLEESFASHERLQARPSWEKYIRFVSSDEFRKALVHKYHPTGLSCGGLGKFVLALLVAIKRGKFACGPLLVDMRAAFLREMYSQGTRDHAGMWFAESLMDSKTLLASADLVPIFESHVSMESAVNACVQMPRWCPEITFPKTLYSGGEWEFNAPAVDMIFRNLATLAGTTIPALTSEDLVGILMMPREVPEVRALSTKPIKPATVSELRELFLRSDTLFVKARAEMGTYARLQYRRWYMSLHSAIVPVPPEFVEQATKEGRSLSHLAIGESGLFTTACGAWKCPFYGKVLAPPKLTDTGPRIVAALYSHITACCVPAMHKTIRLSPAMTSDAVAQSVAEGVYIVPDHRAKLALGAIMWRDLVPNVEQIRTSRGPTYEEWVERLGL